MKSKALRIDRIQRTHDTQMRVEMNAEKVQEYADLMREQGGAKSFPAVVVYEVRRGVFVLADGFHRCEAALLAGFEVIHAEVRAGSQDDAIMWAIQANARHGLPRTNADKKRAVDTLLTHPKWKGKLGAREIARIAGVTHPFVSKLKKELGLESETVQVRRGGQVYEHKAAGRERGASGNVTTYEPGEQIDPQDMTKAERAWYDRLRAFGVPERTALQVITDAAEERKRKNANRKNLTPAEKAERVKRTAERALESIAKQEGRAVTVSFRQVKNPDKIGVHWKS